ncbi:MAG: bifunctional diaminohydroxyphosphoribosylaminopyrimidine deaminase/5-amino-6-(5-phosphoribosylamino)uracil reductase RibD [Thermodesulfobacteriota bacterium]|nr:bifunctional diaminohydroxyphosphoribosylaminopyrimidine deaminase/5-amino-6-(5-phosphoribosylamino)uracil reductase RibD [Thermodesulfobacteriota bacterium]
MKMALRFAKKGKGKVSPNPLVGAIIVKDGVIMAKGYHKRFGGPHAEIDALGKLKAKGMSTEDTIFYITLEPCCHHGKTPPCTDALIKEKFSKIVICNLDPNPKVNGKGIEILRNHGFEVITGILENEGKELNYAYFKYIRTNMPFITVKLAQSLDGKIATASGDSKWISSEPSRKFVHKLRTEHDCVMVGIKTVIADNPLLTVREVKGKSPLRIIVDSKLKIPLDAKIINRDLPNKTLIATTKKIDLKKLDVLKYRGVNVLQVESDEKGRIDLFHLFSSLGNNGISSVLVEGGGRVVYSLLKNKIVDRFILFIAPRIIGHGIEWAFDLKVKNMEDVLKFRRFKFKKSGHDIMFEGWI